jgi:hypothetical protein
MPARLTGRTTAGSGGKVPHPGQRNCDLTSLYLSEGYKEAHQTGNHPENAWHVPRHGWRCEKIAAKIALTAKPPF